MSESKTAGTNGLADAILGGFLVLSAVKLTFGIERVLDLSLYDESVYLHSGRGLLSFGFRDAQSSPLYQLWYFCLSTVVRDPIQLFYANYRLVGALLAVVFYLVARSMAARPLIAFAGAAYLLNTPLPFTFPLVSSFGSICVLLSIVLAQRLGRLRFEHGLSIAAAGILIGSFARPEWFVSFLALTCVILVLAYRNRTEPAGKRASRMLVVVLVCAALGTLLLLRSGGRSIIAFGQHYALNLAQHGLFDSDPWRDWESAVRRDFGEARSVTTWLLANPRAVLRHVGWNLRGSWNRAGEIMQIRAPAGAQRWDATLRNLSLALLAAICGWAVLRGRARLRDRAFRVGFLPWCCVSLSGLLSVLVIYPREHYLIAPLALGLALVLARTAGPAPRAGASTSWCIAAGLAVLVATPSRALGWFPRPGAAEPVPLENIETVRYLRSAQIRRNVWLLETEGGIAFYAGDQFYWVRPPDARTRFDEFLARRRVDMVLLSPSFAAEPAFAGDAALASFLKSPQSWGFRVFHIPKTGRRLAVRSAVAENASFGTDVQPHFDEDTAYPREPYRDLVVQWVRPVARLRVNANEARRFILRFNAAVFDRPRRVSLAVNGREQGTAVVVDRVLWKDGYSSLSWSVALEQGENTLELRTEGPGDVLAGGRIVGLLLIGDAVMIPDSAQ